MSVADIYLTLVIVGVAFFAICGMAWQINNPKANQMSFYTHFNDAIHFRSLPAFQE